MVVSPIDFPMFPVSDVSENQVVLSKLLLLTAPIWKPLEKKCVFFQKKTFDGISVTKWIKTEKY
ncbi:hypothetical protein BIY22_17435 [Vibrio panuliri]|uniref:Uncharacterized protein n=1 Tax=Vibrio panuliri TaxID=1381081 RepID=A0A1Q9HM41_9VIBR|nr:hypothetical protein BIY22_17435 [Vibrio panuliri]OLQ94747.1 hypothetical protein BIY20_00200 [Vibrio panuliri]